jgi:hypothetical protein
MASPFEEQKVRRELLEWSRHYSLSIQLRCITIAINVARLAGDSGNLKLRDETMRHITSLEQALHVTRRDQRYLRRASRTKFENWAVKIEVAGRKPVIASVWDVSPQGICLLVAADIELPAAFTIDFDNIPRQAQVVWRRWSFLGVKFTDQLDAEIRERYELMVKRAADREESATGRGLGTISRRHQRPPH